MTASGDGWLRARVVSSGTLAVATLLFGVLMLRPPISRTARVVPEQTSIETGLVDLSPPAPSRPATPTPQAASVPPATPLAEPQPHKAQAPKPKEDKPHHSHGASAGRHAQAMLANTPASSTDTSPPSAETRPSAPPPDEPARTEGPAGGTRAARAVFQPLPELPAELRRHVLTLEAVVRFTIATDGSAIPELEEATPDPQINRILLNTFRRWRFFPAIQDDRPVRSTLMLRVPITVK